MMPVTQRLLNTIRSCSHIVRGQIPAACERVSQETLETILRLPVERARLALLEEDTLYSVLEDCTLIYTAVGAFYVDVLSTANQHTSELSDNQYAARAANEWRSAAGKVLASLMIGFEKIPEARALHLGACKLLNDHLVQFPAASRISGRMSLTKELTEKIRAAEPSYVKPVKTYNLIWLVVLGLAAMLFTLPGGVLPMLELAAMAVCFLSMHKGWKLPGMISACVPVVCRLLTAMRGYMPLYALGYMQPLYTHLLQDFWLITAVELGTVLLGFACAGVLALYNLGLLHTELKNLVTGITAGCFATVGVVAAAAPFIDGNPAEVPGIIFLLGAGCAAAGLTASFAPANQRD